MIWSPKSAIVALIGRPLANRLASPFHSWLARRRTISLLQSLPSSGTLVNIGCGYRPLSGWVNLDLVPGQADMIWDIRDGLPFRDQTIEAIFCEHVIEHLTAADGMLFIKECRRVLQCGGVLRLSTPDARKYLFSYVYEDEFLKQHRFGDGSRLPIDLINQMMRENGHHLWVYDVLSLTRLLREAGFQNVQVMESGSSKSSKMEGIDSKEREFESLYMEAIREY